MNSRGKPRRAFTTAMLAGVFLLSSAVGLTTPAGAATATQVDLGTATSFAVLAGSTVTNTGPSVINGDLGVYPGTSVTGFPPGIVNGTVHATDAVAQQAQSDLTIAYNDAAGRAPDVNLTGQDLGGLTLTPGVYKFDSSAQLTGTLILDGQGNPDAVFIFQIGSTLTTAPNSSVVLINGAQACHVFYQVGSSATLDTNTTFVGNILALTSITANTSATVDGRLLAQNGAVTLDTNTVTKSTCAAGAPAPSITVATSASPTSRPAPGGFFTYTVTVTNTGSTDVTLTTLTDSISGDLNGKGTCATGGTIAAGASNTCMFARNFTGVAGSSQTDTVTAGVTDASGTTASGSGSATVTITAAAPAPTGVLEICKKADNSNGTVSGSYTFTFANRSVTVPVGYCSGPLTLPTGNLTVTEVAKSGIRISACATRPVDRLAKCDPGNSLAVVKIVAGGVSNETLLTITNRVASSTDTGAIKVCKIAGAGITVGSTFAFNVGGKAISVPAGPASQGGYCKIVYGFTRGTNVIVTEAAKSGVHVSAITVAPADRKVSASTTNRTVTVKVGSGFTVVSFTNAAN
jgi:uncharacterized repeat protein (TIGR01451 family)